MENISMSRDNLLISDPSQAIPYVVLTGVIILLGVVGNSLILTVYLTNKELRKTGNEFTINLALADLSTTGFAGPMCIVGAVTDEKFFLARPWFCQVIFCLCITACLCALFSLTTMTFNRYLFVCHKRVQNRLFGRRSVNIVSCMVLWFVAFAMEVGNIFGWEEYVFDVSYHACVLKWEQNVTHTITLAVFLVPSMFIMIMSHVCIFLHIRKSKFKVYASHGNPSTHMATKKAWVETMKSSKVLLIILCAVAVTWFPYAIVIVIDLCYKQPSQLHLWLILLAHVNSALNFFIYCATNRLFKKGLLAILQTKCLKRTTETPAIVPQNNDVNVQRLAMISFNSRDNNRKLEARGPCRESLDPCILVLASIAQGEFSRP